METRDEYRDCHELGKLYSDKATLRRLKAIVHKHLENIERERSRTPERPSKYQAIKSRLKDQICKLKNRKVERVKSEKLILKEKFSEKINNLISLKEEKAKEPEVETIVEIRPNRKGSVVSFKLDTEPDDIPEMTPRTNFRRLKNELKAKIETMKKKRQINCKCSGSGDENFE